MDFFSSIAYLKALDASFKEIQLLPSDVFYIIPMEFESFPNGSDGESERPFDSDAPPAKDGFTITPRHAGILKGYLEEFQGAKTEARNRIVETAMGELYALHPEDPFDKKEAKKVSLPTSNYKGVADSLQLAENPELVLQPLYPPLSPVGPIYPEVVGSECVLPREQG